MVPSEDVLVHWKAELADKDFPPVAVCIEGPVNRSAFGTLQRTNHALPGLGVAYWIAAIVGATKSHSCISGLRLHRRVFRSVLVDYWCIADRSLTRLRGNFLDSAQNASWWINNEWRFSYWRMDNQDTMNLYSLVRNLIQKSACLNRVQGLETSAMKNFTWVIYFRVDLEFLGAHPPIGLMEWYEGIWIPDGQDFGGLNDRWAVVHRRHAHAYFRQWEAFVDGSAVSYFNSLPVQPADDFRFNPEVSLLLHLHFSRSWPTVVRRFLGTAAVRCFGSARKCEVHIQGKVHSLALSANSWRSMMEFSDAFAVSSRLHSDAWVWTLAAQREFHPPWLVNETTKTACCNGLPGILDENLDCFDGIFHTYARSCNSNYALLSITPPSSGGSLPRCWRLTDARGGAVCEACISNDTKHGY